MSKSKKIVDQEEALSLYFDEMLLESTSDTLKHTARSQSKTSINEENTQPFQALLFDINGLQLAIHTQDIKAILPWPETSLTLSDTTDSGGVLMATYTQESKQIRIINTAKIILPLEHQHNIAKPSFILIVGEGRWALSCHKINSVTTLAPEEIRWRKNSGIRPWLAGTAIKKSCSIITITKLIDLVETQLLA